MMKQVIIEFEDANQANAFRDEMKKRFHYPKTTSKYQVVHGKDDNGNTVFISSCKQLGIISKAILSGFFEYCFDDYEGNCHEFATLAEAKRAAKQYTKENPNDEEIHLYGLSSYYYKNGKEV